MEPAEVDAVSQGEDVGLLVQFQPQFGKLRPDATQRLAGRFHVGADHIPVVHIHPGQRQVQLFIDEVHHRVDEKDCIDVAGLVSQGQPLHRVDILPHQPLQALVVEPFGQRAF